MKRDFYNLQSTEFSFSRFLTPHLCNFDGWAIFADNDMIMLDDIKKLWDLRDEKFAVQVVKHDYVKYSGKKKFLGETQTSYAKKNWSSLMMMNCKKCKELTPEYVSTATGLELHQFKWLESEDLIGDIPNRWNHLVDIDKNKPIDEISNLHYTSGGPYYTGNKGCSYANVWLEEYENMKMVIEKKLI
jgi:lipopolysaccharide biosynthesis glycosyltransferase